MPPLMTVVVYGLVALMLIGHGAATDMHGVQDCEILSAAGKYAEAIQCYDQIISDESNPTMLGLIYFMKSNCLYAIGDRDGAIEAANEAANLDPQYAGMSSMFTPNEITRTYAREHASNFNNTTNMDRNNVTALIDKANDFLKKGMHDEALQCSNDAIALDSKNIIARFLKAQTFAYEYQTENLTKTLDEIADMGFKDTQVWEYFATMNLDHLQLRI